MDCSCRRSASKSRVGTSPASVCAEPSPSGYVSVSAVNLFCGSGTHHISGGGRIKRVDESRRQVRRRWRAHRGVRTFDLNPCASCAQGPVPSEPPPYARACRKLRTPAVVVVHDLGRCGGRLDRWGRRARLPYVSHHSPIVRTRHSHARPHAHTDLERGLPLAALAVAARRVGPQRHRREKVAQCVVPEVRRHVAKLEQVPAVVLAACKGLRVRMGTVRGPDPPTTAAPSSDLAPRALAAPRPHRPHPPPRRPSCFPRADRT